MLDEMDPLKEKYLKKVAPELLKELGRKNILSVPRPKKIVVSMGVGWAKDDPKLLEVARSELATICGQQPGIRKAKRSEAGFKLRAGEPVGLSATLRGDRMWSFLNKLVNIVLPRVRDFRGLSRHSFDRRGNYSFGLVEHTVFPEIDSNKTDRIKSLGVTIITTASGDEEASKLLEKLGMPFRRG